MKKITCCLISVLLCGCTNQSSSSVVENKLIEESHSEFHFEEENAYGWFPGNAIFPARNGDYIFHVYSTTGVIYYQNPLMMSDKLTAFCDKPGCTHEDETCSAYIGEWSFISYYKDKFYYTCNDEDGLLNLKELDPLTNSRRIIYVWDKPENSEDTASGLIMSYDNAFVRKNRWTLDMDTGEQGFNEETYCVDINTGECKSIAKDIQYQTAYSIIGGTDEKAIFIKYQNEHYQTIEEWISHGNSEESYYEVYLENVWSNNNPLLISLDMKTKEETEITNVKEGFINYSDNYNKISNDQLLYVKNDEVHFYDIKNGKDNVVYHFDDIINYWYFDGRILFLTADENHNNLKVYSYDYQINKLYSIANHGNDEVLEFSLDSETKTGFIANITRQWIKKADFYNDNYEDIVTLW